MNHGHEYRRQPDARPGPSQRRVQGRDGQGWQDQRSENACHGGARGKGWQGYRQKPGQFGTDCQQRAGPGAGHAGQDQSPGGSGQEACAERPGQGTGRVEDPAEGTGRSLEELSRTTPGSVQAQRSTTEELFRQARQGAAQSQRDRQAVACQRGQGRLRRCRAPRLAADDADAAGRAVWLGRQRRYREAQGRRQGGQGTGEGRRRREGTAVAPVAGLQAVAVADEQCLGRLPRAAAGYLRDDRRACSGMRRRSSRSRCSISPLPESCP